MKGKIETALFSLAAGAAIGALATLLVAGGPDGRRVRADYDKWQKLNLILGAVKDNYVDTVDVRKLTDVAVQAALGALDPHSVYLPPVDLEKADEALAGRFFGVGIVFNVPQDTAILIDVIPGGPAERAGMRKGDKLLRIDGRTVAGVGFPQDSMVCCMKGERDTRVKLSVLRGGESELEFDLLRGEIPVHSVEVAYMLNDTSAYLKLSKFNATTFTEVQEATDRLKREGMRHLVLDLRGNSGGYFVQALLLSDLFLERGEEIVYIEGLHRRRQAHLADGKGSLRDIGLTILIDENSASSSEIFAGAMQDNDRGVVVGRRSFGKGLVQESINYSDGSGVRLTVARFHTPSGRCIQKPYTEDYDFDIYKRYTTGEMFDRDSIRTDDKKAYLTKGGRTVYGGGGIIPDVFVPLDTAHVSRFALDCRNKGVDFRFSARMFDLYRNRLLAVNDFQELDAFLDGIGLGGKFLAYASARYGLRPAPGEWEKTEVLLLQQIKAMIGRYSKLGELAFYRMYEPIDPVLQEALKVPDRISLTAAR